MADVATPSGAARFDGGAQDKKKAAEKKVIEKPEKPDEAIYKANLEKAEKEHAGVMKKFVCDILTFEVGARQRRLAGDIY